MKFHKRRRLKNYDFASNGAYFITFCTFEKLNRFWTKDVFPNDAEYQFNDCGMIMQRAIEQIPAFYPSVSVDHYVIMPNHVHLILVLNDSDVSVSTIIRHLKSAVTKEYGAPIFQRSFHDHIIRDFSDYEMIWNYIEDNPQKWNEDKYYLGSS